MTPLTFLLASAMLAPVGDYVIVPGTRIGQVVLGQDNPTALGNPTSSDGAAGHIWSTWKGKSGNTIDTFVGLADKGYACSLVRATSSAFDTSDGVSTGQTWKQIKARYSGVSVTSYQSKQFGRKLIVMDNAANGIAFELTVNSSGKVTDSSKCMAIWVHPKGDPINLATWTTYQASP